MLKLSSKACATYCRMHMDVHHTTLLNRGMETTIINSIITVEDTSLHTNETTLVIDIKVDIRVLDIMEAQILGGSTTAGAKVSRAQDTTIISLFYK